MDGRPAVTGGSSWHAPDYRDVGSFILLLLCGRILAVAQEQAFLPEEVL